jgi:hypothetical protein
VKVTRHLSRLTFQSQAALTPDPSPTLRERGEPVPADFSLRTPLSRSVGEGRACASGFFSENSPLPQRGRGESLCQRIFL